MNFFKTVFSEEPDSPPHDSDSPPHDSDSPPHNSDSPPHDSDKSDPNNDTTTETTAWSFGGLIQTLASKSESVLENYRRDLEEFSSGLKIETSTIREVASRAVKDFPSSLDVGASVAQESLETVGQAIDDIGTTVWKSTAQIISHGRDSLLSPDYDSDSYDSSNNDNKKQLRSSSSSQGFDLKRYSRFESLVNALQSDVNTYLDEPEDLENFNEWKLGFVLDNKEEEIQNLIDSVVEEIYDKIVPEKIDHESFWRRYFYKLDKLKQAEDARAKLVKRTISGDEEEDLSWDFDDDDYDTDAVSELTKDNDQVVTGGDNVETVKNLEIENDRVGVVDHECVTDGGDKLEKVNDNENVASNVPITVSDRDDRSDVKNEASEVKTDNDNGESWKDSDISVVVSDRDDKLDVKNAASEVKTDNDSGESCKDSDISVVVSDRDDKLDVKNEASEVKTDNDNGESCKDSDISVVSSQPSMPEEEDISWDEIEDVESNDDNRGDAAGSESRIDLRKRLSAASVDQDEDLSWDIEDDDEAVKS